MIQFPINIKPQGAVRMTQRSKWKDERAKTYLSYKDRIAWEAKKHMREPIKGAISVTIAFYFPIPESWSKRKKDEANDQGILPTVKPDIDNTVKAIFDALNGVAWEDDRYVVDLRTFKRYGYEPGVVITIKSIEEVSA